VCSETQDYWALPAGARAKQRQQRQQRRRQRDRAQREFLERLAERQTLAADARVKLAKTLGMMGSAHDGEVLVAARQAERLRAAMGKTWDELLRGIPL
jgi:hypothetical protein